MDNMKHDKSAQDHSLMSDKKQGTQYTCTMHPEIISDKPGKCPKCGMELVPKDEEHSQKMEGMGSPGVTRPMMDMEGHQHKKGHAQIYLDTIKMSADRFCGSGNGLSAYKFSLFQCIVRVVTRSAAMVNRRKHYGTNDKQ